MQHYRHLALIILWLLLPAWNVPAQTTRGFNPQKPIPVTWQNFLAWTKLPVSQQELPATQREIQSWFLWRVESYMHCMDAFAVKSLCTLGDIDQFRERMAPPTGHGTNDMHIVFRTQGGLGVSKNGGEPFAFPIDNEQSLHNWYNGDANATMWATCWHELNHPILELHTLTVPAWGYSATGDATERRHHAYIDMMEHLPLRTAEHTRPVPQ
jgi:hypothetical protein